MLAALTLVLAAAMATASPSPAPSATPASPADPCALEDGHTNVLATINRPTVGFSPCAVKPREALIELGYQANLGNVVQHQTGQGFLRFGVVRNVEVDVIGPAYIAQRAPTAGYGFADMGAGLKWEFAHTSSSSFGIDVLFTTPSGAPAFTIGSATQTANVNDSFSFGKFGVGTTFGVSHQNGYAALFPSVVLSNQFNSRAQWYAETFAQSKSSPAGKGLFGLDGGVQYMITPELEFDIEFGRTITDTARVHYYGAGIGVRL